MGTHLIVLSEDPLTTSRSLYWRHAMPRLCPFRVRTNSHVLVLHTCETREKHSSENYPQAKVLNFSRRRIHKQKGADTGQWNENSHSILMGKEWAPGISRTVLWGVTWQQQEPWGLLLHIKSMRKVEGVIYKVFSGGKDCPIWFQKLDYTLLLVS